MTIQHYTVHAVKVGASTWIDQVIDQSYDPGIDVLMEADETSIDALATYVTGANPSVAFTTTGIAKGLTAVGFDGLALTSAEVYFKKRLADAVFSVSADHKKLAIATGIIVPVSLTCDLEGSTLSYQIIPTWNGSADPIVVSAASISGTLNTNERFVCGPVKIGGVDVSEVTGWSINYGINVATHAASSEQFNRLAFIRSRRPSMSITTKDATALTTYGGDGAAVSGDVVAFLRKCESGATVYADETAVHVSVTIAGGVISANAFSAAHRGNGEMTITVTPRETTASAGAVAPIAIDAATAIA